MLCAAGLGVAAALGRPPHAARAPPAQALLGPPRAGPASSAIARRPQHARERGQPNTATVNFRGKRGHRQTPPPA
eukprot:8545153-Pyramimonas_sp.AAC.1